MYSRLFFAAICRHQIWEYHPRIWPMVSLNEWLNNVKHFLINYFFRFNYRATAYMVKHGFYNFLNWFDERAWYPLGRIVGGTVYPGLMLTSGSIHYILHLLHINVHIRDICVFLAPIFRWVPLVTVCLAIFLVCATKYIKEYIEWLLSLL